MLGNASERYFLCNLCNSSKNGNQRQSSGKEAHKTIKGNGDGSVSRTKNSTNAISLEILMPHFGLNKRKWGG